MRDDVLQSGVVAGNEEYNEIQAQCALWEQWHNVAASMFTLFIVMTGEGWNEIAINAMTLFPEDTSWAVALFFIVFVTFTNLMVMNLIIGVIVEKIMSSTREQDKEHSLKPTEKDFDVLEKVFEMLDGDGDGTIDTVELERVCEDGTLRDELSELHIYVGTDSALLMQLWDSDNSGTLDFREFVEGAMRIRKSEESQLLLMLQHDLHGYSRTLLDQLSRLENQLVSMQGPDGAADASAATTPSSRKKSRRSVNPVVGGTLSPKTPPASSKSRGSVLGI
jgi:hypothetical protein